MTLKKHFPNFITILNLLCGCLAIVASFNNNLVGASYFIGLAAIFDFLDGMFARLLNVKSEIGKQLDSLADLISFGLAPGIIVFILLKNSNLPDFQIGNINPIPFIAFLIPIFSALRLAKFNIDPEQTESFIGLPTPANAIFIASFPLILEYQSIEFVSNLIANTWFLFGLSILMSSLLVLKIPLFSLKFKTLKWIDNKKKYILLAISIILLIFFKFLSIPLIIIIYILLSFF